MIVVDTNVVVHAVGRGDVDALGALAAAALRRDAEWAAPPLWRSEFCNVLATRIRHAGMPVAHALDALDEALALLGPREHAVDPRLALELAVASGCTAYDCEFVALARALGVPLVTTDKAVLKAFPRETVSLARFGGG